MQINQIKNIDGVEAVLTTDLAGNILQSTTFPYEQNVALMAQNLYAKANIFVKDFVNQYMEQLVFRFKTGFVMITKTDDEKIILILSSNKANLGMLLKLTNENN
ncbi:roadblock/LC7 domain-containing protein [Wenyingzhuangia sp. IMCC45533]